MNPDCGGEDKRCLIADARGEQYRCTSGCGYERSNDKVERPDPIITDSITEALVNVVEECAEVSKEVTKALRFGLDHRYRDPVKRARQYLGQELGQLRATADVLCNAGQIDPLDIQRGYVEKMGKLKTWSNLPHEWLTTIAPSAGRPTDLEREVAAKLGDDPQAIAERRVLLESNEAAISNYVAFYEWDAGEDGYHVPSEEERLLIEDAIAGLLVDGGFLQTFNAWQDKVRATPQAALSESARSATASSEDAIPMPKAWIEAAKCPNCGGQGWTAVQVEAGVFEQEQCQWCFEQWLALGQPQHVPIDSGSGHK